MHPKHRQYVKVSFKKKLLNWVPMNSITTVLKQTISRVQNCWKYNNKINPVCGYNVEKGFNCFAGVSSYCWGRYNDGKWKLSGCERFDN